MVQGRWVVVVEHQPQIERSSWTGQQNEGFLNLEVVAMPQDVSAVDYLNWEPEKALVPSGV